MLFALLNLALCEAAVLEINLDRNTQTGEFSLSSSRLLETRLPGGIRDESDYNWAMFSVSGAILSTGQIIIPGPMIIERDLEKNISTDIFLPENMQVSIYPEYNSRLRNLVIYGPPGELLNIDLMEYNLCNLDSACDSDENRILCPEDCPDSPKDGMCQNIEDSICGQDPDCKVPDPDCLIPENRQNLAEEEKELDKQKSKTESPISNKAASHQILGSSPYLIIPLIVIIIIGTIILSIMIYRRTRYSP